MGDRGNIQVKDGASDNGVFFYSHWSGTELPELLKAALKRGKSRWGDTPYLARVIFCELVRDDLEGETGYGIGTEEMDPEHALIVVDGQARTVRVGDKVQSFQEYVSDSCPTCGRH